MNVWARLIGAAIVLLGGCAAKPEDPAVVAEAREGEPLAVYVNGQGPLKFGIDSGQSAATLVSPQVASRLGLRVVQQVGASDGVSSKPVDVVRIDSARVGTLVLASHLGLVVQPGDASLDGSLGAPFFEGVLVEHDGPAERLRIVRGRLPEPDGKTVLSVRQDMGLPVVTFSIAGRACEAILDTGSEAGLLLPRSMSEWLPLEAPPAQSGRMRTLFGEFDLWTARLRGTVRLGEHEVANPVLTFSDHFTEINVGRAFLKDFRVTIDVRNGRVKMER